MDSRLLRSIAEEVPLDDEERKAGYHQAYANHWVEVSGLSDVDEEDKGDTNVLCTDSVLCRKLEKDAQQFLRNKSVQLKHPSVVTDGQVRKVDSFDVRDFTRANNRKKVLI